MRERVVGLRGRIRRRIVGSGLRWSVCLWVAIVILVVPAPSAADEMITFRWGRTMRIASHELDLESGRLRLNLIGGGSVTVPLSIVSRVTRPDGALLFTMDLDDAVLDPAEEADTVPWVAAQGWSADERWDEWIGEPQWQYRWTDQDVAWAMVPAPHPGATELELRLLSVSYAMRALGKIAEAPVQVVEVSLAGTYLGSIELRHDGWQTYHLPLPPESGAKRGTEGRAADLAPQGFGNVVMLRLETRYRAQPSSFSDGASPDARMLGVALDSVRYIGARTPESEGAAGA